ncbi:MAG TPA: TonB-dependent receptor, partial [Saprospiraceae bacterium]|nr:TonB-dependent receptor [Saprospiraceae bacterium]
QNTYSRIKTGSYELNIIGGIRASYLELNNEFLLSPRVSLAYQPLGLTKDVSFTLASGIYYQSPFYRELRQLNGVVNKDVKSQKSTH